MTGTAIACATVARSVAHHGKLLAHQKEALRRLHQDRPRAIQAAWDASRVPGRGKTLNHHLRGCQCTQCAPTGE